MPKRMGPETLMELLQTIERSQDLRVLARECGLTVRELRKRLARWRRELKTVLPVLPSGYGEPGQADKVGQPDQPILTGSGFQSCNPANPDQPTCHHAASGETLPANLPRAETLSRNPLPATGSPILEVYTDGASRGNPGPASVGVVFRQKNGPTLCQYSATIGRATNNQAEYRAVVAALEHCDRWSVQRVHLFLDSELVVRQLLGIYRVKSQDLLPLYQQAMHFARRRREFRVSYLPRAQNTFADMLANEALDAAQRQEGSLR